MKNNRKQLQLSSTIVTDQELKHMKIEYLKKHGFRRDETSWTNGSKRVRTTLVDDAETPYAVFINIVSKSIQASEASKTNKTSKANATSKANTTSKTNTTSKPKTSNYNKKNKATVKRSFDIEKSQDALDYRVPGSYGTGKRR
jgi:hypothetical protein